MAWTNGLKFVSRDESVKISCDTNQDYVNVSLYKRDSSGNSWRKLPTDASSRLTVLGHTFFIETITISDSGYYRCLAEKWNGETKEFVKGQLVVNAGKYF